MRHQCLSPTPPRSVVVDNPQSTVRRFYCSCTSDSYYWHTLFHCFGTILNHRLLSLTNVSHPSWMTDLVVVWKNILSNKLVEAFLVVASTPNTLDVDANSLFGPHADMETGPLIPFHSYPTSVLGRCHSGVNKIFAGLDWLSIIWWLPGIVLGWDPLSNNTQNLSHYYYHQWTVHDVAIWYVHQLGETLIISLRCGK